MPGFTYVAVDKKGKEKKGNIEADTREKVIDILKNDGLIPVSVKEQGALISRVVESHFCYAVFCTARALISSKLRSVKAAMSS